MTSTTATTTGSNPVPLYLLLALSSIFAIGAAAQFFLAGLSIFDTPLRWSDHRNLGHAPGLLTYVILIPAALARIPARVALAAVLPAILFMAQYAFVNFDQPYVQALHPLNGAIMFALASWIAIRASTAIRHSSR
jgi:hypothetical protein